MLRPARFIASSSKSAILVEPTWSATAGKVGISLPLTERKLQNQVTSAVSGIGTGASSAAASANAGIGS
jgi:hypothetical protein